MAGAGGSRPPWRENPALRVDVPAAEALCGWSFGDELLAVVALHPHLVGFSRLEFLGDAVLNLSVYSAAVLTGVGRDVAVRAVANAALDVRIGASAIAGERRSGDVLEALIGAVHLDGGFAAAWQAALRLAGPAATVPDGLEAPPAAPQRALDRRALAFVGSAVIGAVVADHLCRSEPTWDHGRYSDGRAALVGAHRLATLARQHFGAEVDGLKDGPCTDVLQAATAERFLEGGWDGGVAAVAAFGVLAG